MVKSDQEYIIPNEEEAVPQSYPSPVETVSSSYYDESIHQITPPPKYNGPVFAVSVNGLILGILTTIAGTLQVFAFPMLCPEGPNAVSFGVDVFFGFTLWCGIMFTIVSATGIRTTITRRQSTVHRYIATLILCILVYICGVISMMVDFLTDDPISSLGTCMMSGFAVSVGFLWLSTLALIATTCFACLTVCKNKPWALFTYCFEAIVTHCCPQIKHDTLLVQERTHQSAQ